MDHDDQAKILAATLESPLLEHILNLNFDIPESNEDDDDINQLKAIDSDDYKIVNSLYTTL